MKVRIIILATLALFIVPNGASAAVWAWGCQGQIGGQQVIFNRYAMAVVDSKRRLGNLTGLIDDKIDDLIDGNSVAYQPQNTNEGFNNKTIEFVHGTDAKRKIILTELSSRKFSSKSRLVCGRDETTETFRKVFRYQRENEPPRDITMQCIEYQLSTRGGRKGC